MTILIPMVFWFFFAGLRIAAVLCMLRMIHGFWPTERTHLLFVSLPYLVEVLSLLGTPFGFSVGDMNDTRQRQMRRSFLSTEIAERRNNIRVNLFYLLWPGIAVFVADIAALIMMGNSFAGWTERTFLWAFGISAVVWLSTLLILKHFGPDYGPPPETAYHTSAAPAPEPTDTSRTLGMDADAPGDEW